MFAEFMQEYGMELIGAILTAVVGFLGIAAKRMAQRWLDTKEKKEVAKMVVEYAQQVYWTLGGAERLKIALNAARDMLADRGIDYSEAEMRVMIESVLAQYKGVFFQEKEAPEETAEPEE